MKRLTAASAALMILVSAASCGKPVPNASDNALPAASPTSAADSAEVTDPDQARKMNRITNGMYSFEEIEVPDKCASVNYLVKIRDDLFMLDYTDAEYNSYTVLTDGTFRDFAEIQYELPEEALQHDTCYPQASFAPDGSFTAIVYAEDHNGMKMPETEEESYSFDWEAYDECAEFHYYLCSYDKDGKLLNSTEIMIPEELDTDVRFDLYNLLLSGDSVYAFSSYYKVVSIDPADGTLTVIHEPDNPDNYYYNEYYFAYDRDGKPLFVERIFEDTEYGYSMGNNWKVSVINDDHTFSEPIYNGTAYTTGGSPFIVGYGDYRLCITKEDGLYGMKDDGSEELLINWNNTGISPMYLCPAGDDNFIGIDQQWDPKTGEGINTLIRLYPRDVSEMAEKRIITLGMPVTSGFDQRLVNNYNHSQDKYYVDVVSYGEVNYDDLDYTSVEDNAYKAFEQALISGDIPDIVTGIGYPRVTNLSKKGVFADLGAFMDSDSRYPRSAFVPSLLRCLTSDDGNIYSMSTGFSVMSRLVKTKIWDKPSWTLDEMIEVFDRNADTAIHIYDDSTKQQMLETMSNTLDGLVDYGSGTCDFDSPEFIKLLEFCNRFGDELDKPDKGSDGPEAVDAYWTDRFTWFARDLVLTADCSAEGVSYCMTKYLEGGGEDMIFVGYPSGKDSGGRLLIDAFLSITSACEDKEGAWDFLCYTVENNAQYGYSALISRFEDQIYSEVGAEHTASGTPIPSETKEEANMIKNYILTCDTIENTFPQALRDIINEEAEEYFAGAITAEEAASRIQNRASIFVSENQ